MYSCRCNFNFLINNPIIDTQPQPVQSMSNLPVAPTIGEKRPREEDNEDEPGNAVPPGLRGSGNNNQSMATRQQMGGMQQWQGGGGNMMGQNMASLDALYIADLNWVSALLLVLRRWLIEC